MLKLPQRERSPDMHVPIRRGDKVNSPTGLAPGILYSKTSYPQSFLTCSVYLQLSIGSLSVFRVSFQKQKKSKAFPPILLPQVIVLFLSLLCTTKYLSDPNSCLHPPPHVAIHSSESLLPKVIHDIEIVFPESP